MDKKIHNILYHPVVTPGLAFWRLLWPAYQLSMRGEIQYSILRNFEQDVFPYIHSDVVVFQRFGNKAQTEYIKKIATLRKEGNFRIIYDVDDAIFFDEVPDHHFSKREHDFSEESYTKELMALCDEMTVSTPYLKDYYQKKTGQKNITVLPNRIPFFWAGHFYSEQNVIRNYHKHKSRPRIIYAGSGSHVDGFDKGIPDDFTSVIQAIISTRKEFKWIFMGVCPLPLREYVESKEMEFWGWKPIGAFPKAISKLEGNMMIAPLINNAFNQGKSNIKFLEACAHGLPIACQDITPYKDCPIRFSNGDEMIKKIRETLGTESIYLAESKKGREIVDQNWLEVEGNISLYRDVFRYPFGDERRNK